MPQRTRTRLVGLCKALPAGFVFAADSCIVRLPGKEHTPEYDLYPYADEEEEESMDSFRDVRVQMTLILIITMMGGLAACATTADHEALEVEVEALRAQQESLQQTLSTSKADMAQMIAQARQENVALKQSIKEAEEMLARNDAETGVNIQQMRAEVDRLNGKTEEIDFRLGRMEEDIRIFKEDVDLRLQGNLNATNMPEDATELFTLAESKMNEGETRQAREFFEAFAKRYPKDDRADDATFMVGESYFNEKQYFKALYEYEKILKRYSSSDRTPDAILRIGQSSRLIGKCAQSKLFFETLVQEYKRSKSGQEWPLRNSRNHASDDPVHGGPPLRLDGDRMRVEE